VGSGVLVLALALLGIACDQDLDQVPVPDSGAINAGKPEVRARAILSPTKGNEASGTIDFEWEGDGTRIEASFEHMPPGVHAFHVHELGDCSAPDASSAGPHFAFYDTKIPPDRILGNLGELREGEDGVAHVSRAVPGARLAGARSILGKAVVVHAKGNDPDDPPDGGAGARIACGVIEAIH